MPISSFAHLFNFQATMNKEGGPIPTNRFIFMLGGYPNVLGGGGVSNRAAQEKYLPKGDNLIRSLRYLCESADIPGLTINTTERPGYSAKMSTKMPGMLDYGPFSATFIARDFMSEKEFFDDWISGIKNTADYKGPGATFDNAYMNDIVVDANLLVMSLYNEADADPASQSIRYAICLRDLYPISIDPIQLDWGADGQTMKFNVNFTYSYWEPIIGLAAYAHNAPIVSHAVNPSFRVTDLNTRPVVNGPSTPNSIR